MSQRLLKTVTALALRRIEKFYHTASNTHIFYQPNIGSLGVKGTGDFANEAYADYAEKLDTLLAKLSNAELLLAKEKLELAKTGIRRIREIQFAVPKKVKARLKERADQRDQGLSEFIQIIIGDQVQRGKSTSDIRSWYSEILECSELELVDTPTPERASISVRLPINQLEPVQDLASNLGTRDSKLIKSVVLADYAKHAESSLMN